MLFANKNASRGNYPSELRSTMSVAKAGENGKWLARWSCLNPVSAPLYGLKSLVEEVGVGETLLKDESVRSIFGRFNALGVP